MGSETPKAHRMTHRLLRFGLFALIAVLTLGAMAFVYWDWAPAPTNDMPQAENLMPAVAQEPQQSGGLGGFIGAFEGDSKQIAEKLMEFAAEHENAVASGQYTLNGFVLSDAKIPVREIHKGGPPRDGIPAILEPKFVTPAEAALLEPDDKVIGMTIGEEARAYPLRILVWHEIVNDTVGGKPIAVTYCPLCGTAMVFDRNAGGRELTFGVSGLLYNSDVLMYDHQTESLWSQLKMEAVSGPMAGEALEWLPSRLMTWRAWQEKHPGGKVLSTDTGHPRDYTNTPYEGYDRDEETKFPFTQNRDDLSNKTWIAGVVVAGTAKAYPVHALEEDADGTMTDTVADVPLTITYDKATQDLVVERTDTEEPVPHVRAYWFAWQAFYPDTGLYGDQPPAG